MNDEYRDYFLGAAQDWVCDHYIAVISYIARLRRDGTHLLAASLDMYAYPLARDLGFTVETDQILAGVAQFTGGKNELLEILHNASIGMIDVNGRQFRLHGGDSYSYFSDFVSGDRWYDNLNLRVGGSLPPAQSNLPHLTQCDTDNALRCGSPPFDGLSDLFVWLGLTNPEGTSNQPTIVLRIVPPIDFNPAPEAGLRNSHLRLGLTAHANFDMSKFHLAVRPSPGGGVQSRSHCAAHVAWDAPDADHKRRGALEVSLENADNAEVMLMIERTTVRRQWIIDPTKAENYRLVAVQHFDRNLRKVREALESPDGRSFEKGVGALLFLMGFSAALQPETDAPDIIVSTLGGRVVLVECTTRISDFHEKLGKLVDRKANLTKIMRDRKIPPQVIGVLVCGLPRDQIAADVAELQKYEIPLVTKEDLDATLERVRFHVDPDAVINELLANLSRPDWVKF